MKPAMNVVHAWKNAGWRWSNVVPSSWKTIRKPRQEWKSVSANARSSWPATRTLLHASRNAAQATVNALKTVKPDHPVDPGRNLRVVGRDLPRVLAGVPVLRIAVRVRPPGIDEDETALFLQAIKAGLTAPLFYVFSVLHLHCHQK
jgi:hypothetical protein